MTPKESINQEQDGKQRTCVHKFKKGWYADDPVIFCEKCDMTLTIEFGEIC